MAAGVFFSALILTMSAGVAHADPGFVIAESQVRAGDTVHFSITGGEGRVTYEIEVGDRDVTKGSGEHGAASGQFTIPDFGSTAKTLKVEADIRDSDDETEVNRKLQYLGAALPAPAPAAAPQTAPAVPQQIAAAPATSPAPAAAAPTAEVPKAKHRSKSTPRKHSRKRHKVKRRKVKRHRAVSRRNREHTREAPVKAKRRARRPAPRTAPLFDGVPEPGSENYSPEDQESSEPKKRAARTPVFASTVASRANGEPAVAIILPGLLGLAGLMLTAATVARRRRNR